MDSFQFWGTVAFGLAVFHTFWVKQFQNLALKFKTGSLGENLFHLLGEVEVVFGLWAGILFAIVSLTGGSAKVISFAESLSFTEPIFVFVIMVIAASRPILTLAGAILSRLSRMLPLRPELALYFTCLSIGPLLGSWITEPAAMTVTALLLKDRFFESGLPERVMYVTLGTLFVNISIGGAMTPFAAPPVLMVAGVWGWDLPYVFSLLGWKVALATLGNAALATAYCARHIKPLPRRPHPSAMPMWMVGIQVVCLALAVLTAHHSVLCVGLFLFFLGIATITEEYQTPLNLRESLLVAFFLSGLVVLGGLQRWWLEPLLRQLGAPALFYGTAFLTSFTDNAALTFIGAQVPDLTGEQKYALVAGALAGGGVTVIANAPNPAGFTILQTSFGKGGISPLYLALGAAFPTAIALLFLWVL